MLSMLLTHVTVQAAMAIAKGTSPNMRSQTLNAPIPIYYLQSYMDIHRTLDIVPSASSNSPSCPVHLYRALLFTAFSPSDLGKIPMRCLPLC